MRANGNCAGASYQMKSNSSEFLDMAAKVISRKLPKIGLQPQPTIEALSADEAAKALAAYETKPKHRSELAARLSELAIGAGLKTSTPKAKALSTVGYFQKQSGRKFRVFALDGSTYVIRVEPKAPEK
jgi:hypothetical protein